MDTVVTLAALVLVIAVAILANRWVIRPTVTQVQQVVTPEPAPLPQTPPVVPAPAPKRDLVTIRLVSKTGQSLGTVVMDRKQRRPTLQYRPKRAKTAYTFVAERAIDGGFVYRQVGAERE